jgi:hypothetical protein
VDDAEGVPGRRRGKFLPQEILRTDEHHLKTVVRFAQRLEGARDDVGRGEIPAHGVHGDAYVSVFGVQEASVCHVFNRRIRTTVPRTTGDRDARL